MDATAGLQMSQPRPVPCRSMSSVNVVMPVTCTTSNSSARECVKCSQRAVLCSTPDSLSSVLSIGTQEPQLVPARVQAFTPATSVRPCSTIAPQIVPFVTALHEQTWAESGIDPAPNSTPPAGEIRASGSPGSAPPTSGRNRAYFDA